MKKKLLIAFALALLLPWAASAQQRTVTIGGWTGSNTSYYPIGAYHHYSYSQIIYSSSEMGSTPGYIRQITLDNRSTVGLTFDSIKVYIGYSTDTIFGSTSSWIPESALTEVYSGTAFSIPGQPGELDIPLTTPFQYNGTGNIVVTFRKWQPSYSSSCKVGYTSKTNTILYRNNDSDVTYADHPGTATGTRGAYHADVKFLMTDNAADPICINPQGLAVGSITSNSATISWDASSNYTSYAILYDTLPINTATTSLIPVDVYGEDSLSLTDLEPNTIYYVYLQATCATGTTTDWIPTTFRTRCSPVSALEMPWTYGFEDASSSGSASTFNSCLGRYCVGSTTAYPYAYNLNSHSGTYAGYMYSAAGAHSWLTLPLFEENLSDLYLSFYVLKTADTYGKWAVGVMTDPSDITTFDTLATGQASASGTWEVVEVSLAGYTGNGQYLTILCPKTTAANYTYVDDITVGYPPTCPLPSAVTSANPTSNSIDLSWTSSASEFILEYGLKGFTQGTGDSVTSSTNSITLTGLQMGMTYGVYVTAVCGEDTSNAAYATFTTGCGDITADDLPFVENFEAYGTGTSYPINTCWTKGTNSSSAYPYPYATAAINGARGLYFYSNRNSTATGTSYYSWAALPPIEDNLDMNALMLTFNAKRYTSTSAAYHSMILVGVADSVTGFTSAGLIDSTVIWIDTIDLTPLDPSTIESEEVSFANYLGEGKYVVFYAPIQPYVSGTTQYNYIYIDDVALRFIPSCYWPTAVALDNVTNEEAEISWTPDPRTANPSGWNVEYGVHGFTRGEGETVTSTTTSVALENLLSNTEYDVYVSADCGGDVSDPAIFTFRTLCSSLDSLPYAENFDSYTSGWGNTPDCWLFLNQASTSSAYPQAYVYSSTTYADSANCLYFKSSSTTPIYAILPSINANLNTLQIGFTYRNEGVVDANGTLSLGYMTNPYVDSTFVEVATFDRTTTLTHVDFPFGAYDMEGGSYHIAFKYTGGTANNYYLGIDNVVVGNIPSCQLSTDLTADSVTTDYARLTWRNYSEEVSSYHVYYSTQPEFSLDTCQSMTVTDTVANLNGLTQRTDYYWTVVADCGDVISTIPAIQHFRTRTDCGENSINIVDTIGDGTSSSSSYAFYGSTSYRHGYTSAIFTAEELNDMGLQVNNRISSIWLHSGTTGGTMRHAKVYVAESSLATYGSTVANDTMDRTTMTLVYSGDLVVPANSWVEIPFTTPFVYSGSSNLRITFAHDTVPTASITFYYTTYNSSNYNNCYGYSSSDAPTSLPAYRSYYRPNVVFDICTEIPNCVRPSNVTLLDYSDNAMTLTWTGSAASYEVALSTTSINPDSTLGMTTYTFNSDTATLTGLTPNTTYYYYVRALCGNDQSEWSFEGSFTTACAPMSLPYTEDFESYVSGSSNPISPCWVKGTTSSTAYPYPYSTNAVNGVLSLYFYGYRSGATTYYSYAALPMMADSVKNLSMSFNVRRGTSSGNAYNTLLVMGVMSNPADISTFEPVDTLDLFSEDAASVHGYEVFFNNYTGNGQYIAILAPAPEHHTGVTTSYNYAYVDDVTVDLIPTCVRPTNVTVNNITASSAMVHWQSEAPIFDIEYGPAGFEHGTGTMVTSTTDSVALTGLLAGTLYDVYVRAHCTVNDVSNWSFSYNFYTACGIFAVPYTEGFENYGSGSSFGINPCWVKNTNNTTAYPYPTSTSVTGQRSLYFYSYQPSSSTSTAYYSYAALPEFNAPVNTLELTFNMRRYSTTTDYYTSLLVVGVMTNPNDISTFTTIDTIDLRTANASSVHAITIDFDSYTDTGKYITLLAPVPTNHGTATYTYNYVYVDDIVVDLIPACPRVRDLVAFPLQHSSIVAWTDSVNTGWNVEYDTVAFTPGTGHMTPVHVTTTSATITGLDSATTYHVYVYPDCGTDIYFRHTTVTTLTLAPDTVPYFCDFEATGNNGWEFVNGTQVNHWMVGDDTASFTGRALFVTNDDVHNAYTITSASYVFATRTFELEAGNYVCSFDWKAQGETTFDFIRAALVPAGTQLRAGDYCGFDNNTTVPAGGFDLGGRLNLHGTDWQNQVDEITLTTAGTYNLVFLWRNDPSAGSQPPAAIDNISLMLNTCPRVEEVVASNVEANNVTLDWTDMAGASQWQVRFNNGDNSIVSVVNSHPTVVTGLSAMTNYSVAVRPICSATDTGAWSAPISVTTDMCNSPVIAEFDTVNGTTYNTPVNNLWKYTLTETIIDSAELAGMTDITAIAYSYSYGTAMTDKTNVTIYLQPTTKTAFSTSSDFVHLDSSAVMVYQGDLNCSQGWNYFSFSQPFTWDGHSNLLVIVDDNSFDYNSSSYVFDKSPCDEYKTIAAYSDTDNPDPSAATISGTKAYYKYRATMKLISCGPSCEEPLVTSIDTTFSSITLNWTNSDYTELVLIEGEWNEAMAEAATPVVSTTGTYTFIDLYDSTQYSIGLRQMCDEDFYSNWTVVDIVTPVRPCFMPTGVSTSNVSYNSVDIDWTPGRVETAWEIHVACVEIGVDTVYVANQHPYTVTGLSHGYTYSFEVRSDCAEDVYSDWTATQTFTTTTCQPVSNVSASNVTSSGATISWTAPAGATNFELEYGMSGFNRGQGTTVTANTNSYAITGLSANMAYDVYVRTICATGVYSSWSTKTEFTTANGEGIDDVNAAAISLYPNPASSTVTLTGIEGMATVTVVDMNGRVSGEWNVTDGKLTIDVSEMAQGAYFVRIVGEQVNAIRKLIVR